MVADCQRSADLVAQRCRGSEHETVRGTGTAENRSLIFRDGDRARANEGQRSDAEEVIRLIAQID